MVRGVPDEKLLFRAARLFQNGRWDKARQLYARYKRRHPKVVLVDYMMGVLAYHYGWRTEALLLLLSVANRRPKFTLALYNIAEIYLEQGDPAKSLIMYRKALTVDPYMLSSWNGAGCALLAVGETDKAMGCFDRAIALAPNGAEARYNRSHALIMRGGWLKGWAAHEARWEIPGYVVQHQMAKLPHWKGEPLKGRTLLVEHEQGAGDTMMLMRYHWTLSDMGATVLWRVPGDLVRLARWTFGDKVVYDNSDQPPDADYVVGVFSLPHRCGTTVSTVPFPNGYIKVPA